MRSARGCLACMGPFFVIFAVLLVAFGMAIYRVYAGMDRFKALMVLAFGVVVVSRTSGAAVGGYLTELRRTRIGSFDAEGAVKLEDLTPEKVLSHMRPAPA